MPPEGEIEGETRIATTVLGGHEFRGAVEHRDPEAPQLTPPPEGVPEKFWDGEKGALRQDALLKAYGDLEKKIGAPKEEAEEKPEGEPEEKPEGEAEEKPEGETEEKPEGDEDKSGEGDDAPLATAVEAAKAAYAETGELSEDVRKPLIDLGISNEQIDLYLTGVKATEQALQLAAHEAAGSADDLAAAMAWAGSEASGWTDKKRIAFNAQMGDPETIKLAVPGLMAEFRKANPTEGSLLNINGGVSRGDVYGHMDEFTQDLAEADRLRDPVKRRAAIAKLRASRKAGTIKSQGKKSPLF